MYCRTSLSVSDWEEWEARVVERDCSSEQHSVVCVSAICRHSVTDISRNMYYDSAKPSALEMMQYCYENNYV